MQDETDRKNGSSKHVKQKHVGDETPNPLPDGTKPAPGGEADDKDHCST